MNIEGDNKSMKIKIKQYLNPAMDKAMREYKKELFKAMAKKYAIQKRDYRAILREASKNWGQEYLFGYVRCLKTHGHIMMKEAMQLIDYATALTRKKERDKNHENLPK